MANDNIDSQSLNNHFSSSCSSSSTSSASSTSSSCLSANLQASPFYMSNYYGINELNENVNDLHLVVGDLRSVCTTLSLLARQIDQVVGKIDKTFGLNMDFSAQKSKKKTDSKKSNRTLDSPQLTTLDKSNNNCNNCKCNRQSIIENSQINHLINSTNGTLKGKQSAEYGLINLLSSTNTNNNANINNNNNNNSNNNGYLAVNSSKVTRTLSERNNNSNVEHDSTSQQARSESLYYANKQPKWNENGSIMNTLSATLQPSNKSSTNGLINNIINNNTNLKSNTLSSGSLARGKCPRSKSQPAFKDSFEQFNSGIPSSESQRFNIQVNTSSPNESNQTTLQSNNQTASIKTNKKFESKSLNTSPISNPNTPTSHHTTNEMRINQMNILNDNNSNGESSFYEDQLDNELESFSNHQKNNLINNDMLAVNNTALTKKPAIKMQSPTNSLEKKNHSISQQTGKSKSSNSNHHVSFNINNAIYTSRQETPIPISVLKQLGQSKSAYESPNGNKGQKSILVKDTAHQANDYDNESSSLGISRSIMGNISTMQSSSSIQTSSSRNGTLNSNQNNANKQSSARSDSTKTTIL
jgi:hypothetical protein